MNPLKEYQRKKKSDQTICGDYREYNWEEQLQTEQKMNSL